MGQATAQAQPRSQPSRPTRSVAIIGAGLAGLAAGCCCCQMNGFESRIFEHHTVPGGVASYWTRQGYHIDGGLHFLMGRRPGSSTHELYRLLGSPLRMSPWRTCPPTDVSGMKPPVGR